MKKIYLCGAITSIGIESASRNFEAMEREVPSGVAFINPMKLPHNHDKEWHSYMRECIVELMWCNTIMVHFNYKKSKGAMLEVSIAKELGMEIIWL
jgi:hypothetical protein